MFLFQVKEIPLETDSTKAKALKKAPSTMEVLNQLKAGDYVYLEKVRNLKEDYKLASINENTPANKNVRFKFGAAYSKFSYDDIEKIHKFTQNEALEITTKDGTKVTGNFVDVKVNSFVGNDIQLFGINKNKQQTLFLVHETDISGIKFPDEK